MRAFQADLFRQEADVAPAFGELALQELLFEQGPGFPEGRHLEEGVDEFGLGAFRADGGLRLARSRFLTRGAQGQVGQRR